jgi:amino acid adenylation domain-containing protein
VEIELSASLRDVAGAVARERGSVEERQERRPLKAASATAVGFSFSSEPEPLMLEGGEARVLTRTCDDDLLQAQFQVHAKAGGVELVLRFHPQAVTRTEAERVVDHLRCLIGAAARQGDSTPVQSLEILSSEQRARLLQEFSVASTGSACGELFHWRFEDTAARLPDAPAVVLGDRTLTYSELNERANRLCHALRARGAGPGRTVAILLDRSPELIASVLAVMKSADAYLPLNPDHPTERLVFQTQDAGCSLVLTDEANAIRAAELAGATLRVDQPFEHESPENPERSGELGDLVYLIYTSGSTGVPKGVEVTHGGLANYVAAMVQRLVPEESPPLRFGVVTTMSTDLGNTSVFAALACGGCLELVPVEASMDGEAFGAHFADRPLDVLKITPSHLATLLASTENAILPRRWLILGGEASPWSLIEQASSLGSSSIVNHYGPTETTIGSLTYDVDGRDGAAAAASTVPIGRPIAGTEIYVIDEQLQPVPIGAPGELLIGGAGLARGYRSQPEQTAERFIAHPFSTDPRARVYRTGDVVRFLADGNVEFLGRADDQVKIRGFRVELGEIETVLRSHPAISQVAVLMREESPGDRRLAAYVVGDAPVEDLRALARGQLPDYMVPSAFVRLEELPLTPNGKLDRAALPAPDVTNESTREYVAPSSEIEQRLVEIWAEALGIEHVGVQDDFFELGGHSLLATQVIARIRSAYDVQLPLHSLFTSPRIADLALEVQAAREPAVKDDAELSALLEDLEGLSDEEAERLLRLEASADEERHTSGGG